MKKYCKLLCAVLALALLLTGCGEQEPPATETQEIQQSGPLSLGDQMPELTVTTAQGETLALSELLQQKKVIILNFWFADCIWCIREFPVMEVSYQKYKQDVEILALNPYDPQQHILDILSLLLRNHGALPELSDGKLQPGSGGGLRC